MFATCFSLTGFLAGHGVTNGAFLKASHIRVQSTQLVPVAALRPEVRSASHSHRYLGKACGFDFSCRITFLACLRCQERKSVCVGST